MPWPLNPLTAKQKAQNRKRYSQADYENKQQRAKEDAAELPGGATVQGFNADRRAWKVSTKGGTIYAPALTPGATEGAALVEGAGLLPRESLPITPTSPPVPALLDEEEPPTTVGFGVLYLWDIRSLGGSGAEVQRLVLNWSDRASILELCTFGDPWLDPHQNGLDTNTFRVFALNESEALVIGGGQVPSTVVPPSGARRLSIWLVNADTGIVERDNHQWLFNQDDTAFNWSDELADFKPLMRRLLTGITVNSTLYSQVEVDGGIVNGQYSLTFNSEGSYTLRQGGHNEDKEYLELPNFSASYEPFQTASLRYPGSEFYEYPALFNLFSADSRDILKATSPTEWEVAGTIAYYAPARGIEELVLAENKLGMYYLYGDRSDAEGDSTQTSFNRFQSFIGNNTFLDELAYFVSGSTGDVVLNLSTSEMLPVFNNTGDGQLILVERGYTYRVIARKPYRTSTPEPEA